MSSKYRIDKFFDEEIKEISVESRAVASRAAYELQADIQRQIRRNFVNPSFAFMRGVRVKEFENASYVRLSPILSSYAHQDTKIEGNPNLWILLPDGARLGFKRIGKGFNWTTLKQRYGTRLSFVAVDDGTVVLYRFNGAVKPIYKLQQSVNREQKIEFFSAAERVITNN